MRLTDATGSDVKVELGTFYDDTMSAEDVQRVLKSTDPVEQPAKCRPMSVPDSTGHCVGRPPLGAAFLVLEVVGTEVEDGRNVLVVLRLVGLLARDNQRWRWLCDRVLCVALGGRDAAPRVGALFMGSLCVAH